MKNLSDFIANCKLMLSDHGTGYQNIEVNQRQIIVEDSMDNLTVIIRNRNEEQYIGFTIQSIIDHFSNPEIIVLIIILLIIL